MVNCGLRYQAGYYDYQEFEFYNLNSEQRKTYLTRGKNNEIIKQFNDKTQFHIFENKDEMYEKYNLPYKKVITADGRMEESIPIVGGLRIEKARIQTFSSEDFAQLKKEIKEAPGNYLLEKYAPKVI